MAFDETKLSVLENRLGYRFEDRSLIARALFHSSARVTDKEDEDNEHLEFLGDRVLGLVVAELICKRYDRESEGDIARRFNRLVRKEACAAIARAIDLGDHLVLSSGEEESGGRDKDNILADACEAVMGAMYLDGGFETARGVIRRHWTKLIETWNSPAADPKTALQEWAQGRGLRLPAYREIGREGPAHQPRFTTEVVVEGEKPAAGEGPSKRAAEQAAALALLRRLGIVDATP